MVKERGNSLKCFLTLFQIILLISLSFSFAFFMSDNFVSGADPVVDFGDGSPIYKPGFGEYKSFPDIHGPSPLGNPGGTSISIRIK